MQGKAKGYAMLNNLSENKTSLILNWKCWSFEQYMLLNDGYLQKYNKINIYNATIICNKWQSGGISKCV